MHCIFFMMSYFCSNKFLFFPSSVRRTKVAMAKTKAVAKATAAKASAAKSSASTSKPKDEQIAEPEETQVDTDSVHSDTASDVDGPELHKKRKQFLVQLATPNKTDPEEMQVWKQRKLEEYQSGSRLMKNQILSEWIMNDSRLKCWYSNVVKTREENQEWKEHQKEGWMKPSMIAELHKLNPDKEGDKNRLDFLLETLQSRPCPTFGEKFGDKEYYYLHKDEVLDYSNSVCSGSKVISTSDIKGRVVDPQLQGSGLALSIQEKKSIKIENPMLDALKKEIQKAKKVENTGLSLLPSLVVLKRQLNDEGQALCDKAEKNFLKEVEILGDLYESAERDIKLEREVDHEEVKCKITYGCSTFKDKILSLKNLKIELKKESSL